MFLWCRISFTYSYIFIWTLCMSNNSYCLLNDTIFHLKLLELGQYFSKICSISITHTFHKNFSLSFTLFHSLSLSLSLSLSHSLSYSLSHWYSLSLFLTHSLPLSLPQLYKNRFCGLVVIPEVIDNIKSKHGTFDWLMAKYWVGCLQEAFDVNNTFVIQKTTSVIQFLSFTAY